MNRNYSIKGVKDSVLDIDDNSRVVKNVFNRMGILDSDGDVIETNALNKTLKEQGPQGKNVLYHVVDHIFSVKTTVGLMREAFVETKDAFADFIGVTEIPNTTLGNDILELYKAGVIKNHSISFWTIKAEDATAKDGTRYRSIKEIKLKEGSSVLIGANEQTPNLSVGKSAEVEKYYTEQIECLKSFYKDLEHLNLSDNLFELGAYKIKQLETKVSELLTSINSQSDDAMKSIEVNGIDESELMEKLMLLNIKTKI
jgi:HK97 family phage prohead protease